MGHIANPLRHLLRRLNLHIHISCTCLNRLTQTLFRDLRRLDLTALLRHRLILKRRFRSHKLSHTTGRNQRHIRRKALLNLTRRHATAVQADLRHLTQLQRLKNLLKVLVMYNGTNHIFLFNRQKTGNILNGEINHPDISHLERQHKMHLSSTCLLILAHNLSHCRHTEWAADWKTT